MVHILYPSTGHEFILVTNCYVSNLSSVRCSTFNHLLHPSIVHHALQLDKEATKPENIF